MMELLWISTINWKLYTQPKTNKQLVFQRQLVLMNPEAQELPTGYESPFWRLDNQYFKNFNFVLEGLISSRYAAL